MLVDLTTFFSLLPQSDYLGQCNKSFEYDTKKEGIAWSNVARAGHVDSVRSLLAEGELLVSEYLYTADNKPHQYLL